MFKSITYIIRIEHDFLCIKICWTPREVLKPEQKGEGCNTSRGAQQILMYQKSMFDRYYCIKTFSRSKTLEKMFRKSLFLVYSTLALKGTLPENVLKTLLLGQRLKSCCHHEITFASVYDVSFCVGSGMLIRKTAKRCINSTWIALLKHGLVPVKTWLLTAGDSFLCNNICCLLFLFNC